MASCVCDADGAVVYGNRRACELLGGLEGPGWAEQVAAAVVEALAGEPPARERDICVPHRDGDIHLLCNVEPLRDEAEAIIGAVACVQDVTDVRRARSVSQPVQGWARTFLEAAPIAAYQTDAEGVLVAYNPAAARIWGRRPELGAERWCGSWKLFSVDGVPIPLETCAMAQALRERRPIFGVEAVIERPDGGRSAILAYPTPLFDDDGALVGAINMMVDISERRAAEDRQKVLVDELNHRVKNTLATVQSLAAHSFRSPGDVKAMRGAFEARLMALSHAHNRLAERYWEAADVRDIAAGVTAAFGPDRIVADGPTVELPTRLSVALAMTLHELATNAARHGALSCDVGRVVLEWRGEPDLLELRWREEGGPPPREPFADGFGLRFVRRAVTAELGGDIALEFPAGGLARRIFVPIPSPV